MTLDKARAQYEAANPDGPAWDELGEERQMEILRDAVLSERSWRARKR